MKRQIAFILVMFAVFAVGCTEYPLATDEQREIDVCLNFNAVRPESSTKASTDVTSLESTDVKDLWVLQFNGTSASSGLLMARYYPDYVPGTKVKLLTSDVENYLLFVANSHNPSIEFGKGRTLDEVKDIRIAILTDTEAAGELHSGRYDMIMNGHVQTVVSGASLSLDVPLKRNAVRLNFK
ncbi:MAG: hypothetical protein J6U28_09095, partial [Bacteroidales bacterium]|nr:hypothetical protein [Bacteroidales bacterium]